MDDVVKSWQGRRVLVTGGTGLVGAWLVKQLVSDGARVAVLVRDADPQSEFYRSGVSRQVSVVNGALEDFWSLERAINDHEVDTVFHLAAQAIVGVAQRAPLQTFEANIRGTYNLLEACRQQGGLVKRVVVASSDKAYGTKDTLPYTEDMSLEGRGPYDVSKTCTDLIAQSYYHTYRLPVTIARCGNIYGGGDLNWSRIIPDTIRCCLRGTPLVLRSDGTFVRDYIYVQDVVLAYRDLAAQTARAGVTGEAFNFSPGRAVSVLELVETIRDLMGCALEVDILNTAKAEIHSQYLDSQKAESVLGWAPRYSLEDGLRETIAWYREYLDE